MLALLAASALADPAASSLPNSAGDLGITALDSFQHGDVYRRQNIDNDMLPDRLAKLPAISIPRAPDVAGSDSVSSATSLPAMPVARTDYNVPDPLPNSYGSRQSYDLALFRLVALLAVEPGNLRIQTLVSRILAARDRAGTSPRPFVISPLGDFDTAHERQIRQAPNVPAPVGEIGLRPGDF
jgi:hypothetical protein